MLQDSHWQLGALLSQLCGQASPFRGCCELGLAPGACLVIQHSFCGMRAHCGVPQGSWHVPGPWSHRVGAQKGATAGHKERPEATVTRVAPGTTGDMVTAVSTGHKDTTHHTTASSTGTQPPTHARACIALHPAQPCGAVGTLPSTAELWAVLELCMRRGLLQTHGCSLPAAAVGAGLGFVVH